MISKSFVKLWEPKYDRQKYSLDFYLRHSEGARKADQPKELKENLLALLHWKDGKAHAYQPGENHARPNTLNPLLALNGDRLDNFANLFRDVAMAIENNLNTCTESLRQALSNMWNTVVIPAFLLHVAKPEQLPIIDQHTARAWLALTEGKVLPKTTITWDRWRKYVAFFQKAVEEAGYNHNLSERSEFDRALFAWGKSLKSSVDVKQIVRTAETPTTPIPAVNPVIDAPIFWGRAVPRDIISSSCNVRKALQRYLDQNTLKNLPPWEKQNLLNLKFDIFQRAALLDLLQNPGGDVARQLLNYYREEMGRKHDVSRLPRPILGVFLVGWANINGFHGTTRMAAFLLEHGFGGAINASKAAVYVGKTTGKLFGLLDNVGAPTGLWHEYFGI